ncbi:MAG: hypothetical protein ABF379_17410 [Akkermansiaceae bacterium]|jgi:hypothetical protein
MKKTLLTLIGAAIALVLPSCLEYETKITLNKDGSGTITEEMVLGAQAIGMMEMAAAQGGDNGNPLADMKDEAKLKEKATTYGEGVTFFKSEDIKRDDGSKGVRVTYKFTDINKVTMNPSSGIGELSNMKPGSKKVEPAGEEASFKFADGVLTINLPQPEAGEETAEEEPHTGNPNNPNAAMMAGMMKGMKISAKIVIADGIAETNATHKDGNTITMVEMNMDEIMKNPGAMGSLMGAGENPGAAAKAMQKIEGVKTETKEKVTVKIK